MGMRDFQRQMQALADINQVSESNTQKSAVATHGNDYAVLEIALQNDVNAVRAFPTRAEKLDYKRNRFLPKWLPFVNEYLDKGAIYQNDYLVYCIVYLFDIADFDRALSLAEKAIEQNQSMPQGWQTTCRISSPIKSTTGQIKPPHLVNPWSHIFHKLLKTWRPSGSCTKLSQRSGSN